MLLKTHLFLQLLLFMLTSISLSSSSYITLTALDAVNHKNLICGSIPYPFGTSGNDLPGFEIDCLKEEPWIAILISNNTYTIQEISLQGYIRILTGLIHKRCRGANGKWNESEGSGQFNLDGTPFTLSYQYNMLTVIGYNNLVLISTQAENLTETSGCVTFCNPRGSTTTSLTGSCSGLGCCQATLPGNLKSFDLQFTQVNISNSSVDFDDCIAIYFAQRDDFQSNQGGYYETSFSDANLVQFDWAIGNKSCEASRNDIGSFACKNNSYCYDSPSMVGYLCNCSEGYKGNPYAEDGCTDIDECLESDPCVGRCINLPGNYTCSCPNGMSGDGRKGGSGCKRRMFPLEVALGAGLVSFIKDIIYIVILKLVVSFIKDSLF